MASEVEINNFLMKFGHFSLEDIQNNFSEHFLTLAPFNELELYHVQLYEVVFSEELLILLCYFDCFGYKLTSDILRSLKYKVKLCCDPLLPRFLPYKQGYCCGGGGHTHRQGQAKVNKANITLLKAT